MFASIEAKQALPVTMKDGARGQHLRIQAATPGHQAVEHPAMPVGPVHHRGDGKCYLFVFLSFMKNISHFQGFPSILI
jgi:hypothetical protein